ncbi:hypothetical protein MC885_005882 [Smutsia gigantea]|nr:hypothetical protein MC885_005882 [Smutsia gigantea]
MGWRKDGLLKDINDWGGPPNNDGVIKQVTINPDTTCGCDWVCEHRWRQIRNMVMFSNVVDGQPFTNWWDNGSNQVAFGRGNRGLIVFNIDDCYFLCILAYHAIIFNFANWSLLAHIVMLFLEIKLVTVVLELKSMFPEMALLIFLLVNPLKIRLSQFMLNLNYKI